MKDNDNLSNIFSELNQIGGWMSGFSGEIPYTFTPGKSVLMILDGPQYADIQGSNLPDVRIIKSYFSLYYWEKNSREKIEVTCKKSGNGTNTKLYLKEW